MLLSEVAPQSQRSLAGDLKIETYPCHRNLATVFAFWSGVTYPWCDQNVYHVGGWCNHIVVSILVKLTCSKSKGVVTMTGCIRALAQVLSCWMHHAQLLLAFCICVAIPGHQNWSCSKYSIHCWPWCLASQWHPFMVATWWAIGTMKHKTSSNLQVGMWQWGRAPW